MKETLLIRATSFLLGTSWAFLFLGTYIIYKFLFIFSFIYALLLSAIFFVLALFLILILEHLSRSYKQQMTIERKLDSLLHH